MIDQAIREVDKVTYWIWKVKYSQIDTKGDVETRRELSVGKITHWK